MLRVKRALPAGALESIWPLANKVMWWRRLHKPEIYLSYKLYGDSLRYKWPVLTDFITEKSLVYSFGVGQNASFELGMISELQCQVHAFDPTPRSTAWAKAQTLDPRFSFHGIGICDEDGQAAFFPPENPDEISYTIISELKARADVFLAEVRTLSSIMNLLHHSRIDMLKMDIEGAENRVILQLLHTDIRPPQLLIEFHHGFYGITRAQVRNMVDILKLMGYKIFWLSDRGLEYAFVHRDLLDQDGG